MSVSTSQLRTAWNSIRKWYEKNLPWNFSSYLDWHPGASESEIRAFEARVKCGLPKDVSILYSMCNGTQNLDVFGYGVLLSLDEAADLKEMLDSIAARGECSGDDSDAHPEGPIKKRWWNPMWIPVLDTGGGPSFCVDLDPAEGGNVGQFIEVHHETGPTKVLASSIREYICHFAKQLANDEFVFDAEACALSRKTSGN